MNKLSDERRTEIVYRLLYGETLVEIKGKLYRVVNPDPKTRVLANKLYRDTIYKNRFGPWMKDRDCLRVLVVNGLCSPQIDSNLKEMEKSIEDLKVDLYESMFRQDRLEKTRKTLEKVKSKREELLGIRHMLDYTTLKGYAEMVRRQFLLFSTLYYGESDERVWCDWEEVDMSLLEKAMAMSVEQIVSTNELREVARTEPWRAIWSSTKTQPFGTLSILSEEQRAIVLFSQMYDSIAKHPECPPEDVLEDDDLLDGWLIIERRKREKDQMDKQMKTRLGDRHQSADEVYVIPQGKTEEDKIKDVQKIHNMNTTQSKIVKMQREKQLKNKRHMTDAEFLDRKLQIQQQTTEQFVQQVKGRK